MLLLLYVTAMPTAPILVDRISAPARQDTTAMEKLAEVGENNWPRSVTLYCYNINYGSFLRTRDIIVFKIVANEIGNPLNPPVSFRTQHWRHTSCSASAGASNMERVTSTYSCHGVLTNDFGANLDYLLGPPNQSAKGKGLKLAFLTFK